MELPTYCLINIYWDRVDEDILHDHMYWGRIGSNIATYGPADIYCGRVGDNIFADRYIYWSRMGDNLLPGQYIFRGSVCDNTSPTQYTLGGRIDAEYMLHRSILFNWCHLPRPGSHPV